MTAPRLLILAIMLLVLLPSAAVGSAATPPLAETLAALNAQRQAAGLGTLTAGDPAALQTAQQALAAADQGLWDAGAQVTCDVCDTIQLDPGGDTFLTPQQLYLQLGGNSQERIGLGMFRTPRDLASLAPQAAAALLDPRAVSLDLARRGEMTLLAVVVDPARPFATPVRTWLSPVDPASTSSVGLLLPPKTAGAGSIWERRSGRLTRLPKLQSVSTDGIAGARLVLTGDYFAGDLQLTYGETYQLRVGGLKLAFRTRAVPAAVLKAGFRFQANMTASDRAIFLRIVRQATPAYRRLVNVIDGMITVQIGSVRCSEAAGCAGFEPSLSRYLITLRPGTLRSSYATHLVLHEIGHVLHFSGFDALAWAKADALFPPPTSLERRGFGRNNEEKIADAFAALGAGQADSELRSPSRWRQLVADWHFRPPLAWNPLAPAALRGP